MEYKFNCTLKTNVYLSSAFKLNKLSCSKIKQKNICFFLLDEEKKEQTI